MQPPLCAKESYIPLRSVPIRLPIRYFHTQHKKIDVPRWRAVTAAACPQIYRNAIAMIVVIEVGHPSYICRSMKYTLLRRGRRGEGRREGERWTAASATDRNRTYKVRDTRHNTIRLGERYSTASSWQRFLYPPTTGGSRRSISDNLDGRTRTNGRDNGLGIDLSRRYINSFSVYIIRRARPPSNARNQLLWSARRAAP